MRLHLGRVATRFGKILPSVWGGDKIAVIAECLLRGYWNEGFGDQALNGELRLLKCIKAWAHERSLTVFDVGANHGQWASACLKELPDASMHCFELVPVTYQRLVETLGDTKNCVLNCLGLSDAATQHDVTYYPGEDSGSGINTVPWGLPSQTVRCSTVRGDSYCAEKKIASIDLLKIDVEGHEMSVLRGFSGLLETGKIGAIQFEYGHTWLPSRSQLRDAYEMLSPLGFKIGRIFPKGIMFSDYSMLRDEHFRMGNYAAIHERNQELIEHLQLKRS